uniref:Uncharacterized protein n=1 Tax=Anabas testudineus TaxID=64144 RepID=A0A3Q1IDG6_ANATE
QIKFKMSPYLTITCLATLLTHGAAPSRSSLFKARSEKLKFYSNECLLLLLPRCVYLSVGVFKCMCVERKGNTSASMQVCVCVRVCYMHSRRRRADNTHTLAYTARPSFYFSGDLCKDICVLQ